MSEMVFIGGEYRAAAQAAVSVFDHGLLYGDGVFEGIRAYNGRVFKLERHLQRLYDCAKAIRLEMPLTPRELADVVIETCRRNSIHDGYVRLVVTRGAGDLGIDPRSCAAPNVIVIARPAVRLYRQADGGGVRVITSCFRRNAPDTVSPSIKSLNYLNNVLARIEANDRGADEAILLDHEGYVAEASVDNIFMVDGDALVTPPTSTNLRGITRETVLELAAALQIRTVERRFSLFDLWTAAEVFMCGTSAEIVPVASIDDRQIGTGAAGAATLRIAEAYDRLVRSTGTPIASARAREAIAAN